MKKLLMITLGTLVFAATVSAGPVHAQRGLDERLFGAFIQHRAELNLTEEQNTAVDALLQEMKEARIAARQREIQHIQEALASFVSEDFDPALMLPLPPEVVEQIRIAYNTFMAEKTAALHDILSPEQRQLLVDLMTADRGGDN